MSEESQKTLVTGLIALPAMIVIVGLWLFSASWLVSLEYLPELSSWGRQFVLFSQFGPWSVIVASLMLTAEGVLLHRATGVGPSWTLLMVFLAGLTGSFLGLSAQARASALFAPLPQSPPLSYLSLVPGFLFLSCVQAVLFLPLLLLKKIALPRFLPALVRINLFGQAIVFGGLVAADLPFFLGWR